MKLYTECPECEGDGYRESIPGRCQCCNGSGRTPVRVKLLPWDEYDNARVSDEIRYSAYHRMPPYAGRFRAYCFGELFALEFDSLDAAKAACQEHFERLVMNMLELAE